MSSFTPSGSGGLPAPTITISDVTIPTITNLSMPLAGTEYSIPIPSSSKRFLIKLRDTSQLQLSFSSGLPTYITLGPGTFYGEDIDPTAVLTIYLRATLPGQVAELVSWQ